MIIYLLWWLSGIVGAFVGMSADLKRGIDFTLADLFCGILLSLLGPVCLIMSVVHYFEHNPEFVLIKGRSSK